MVDTVVFLDIDGVCHQVDDPRGPFRPRCMLQLKKVIHGSGASICLSSSWRESDWGREKVDTYLGTPCHPNPNPSPSPHPLQVDKYLVAHEMPEVSWCTPMPEEGYNTRADEILSWCVPQHTPRVPHTFAFISTPSSLVEPKVPRDRQRNARPKPRTTVVVVWRTDTQLPVPKRRPHTHPSRRKPMPPSAARGERHRARASRGRRPGPWTLEAAARRARGG